MADLVHHPADGWGIPVDYRMVQPAQPQGLNYPVLRLGPPDAAFGPGYFQLSHWRTFAPVFIPNNYCKSRIDPVTGYFPALAHFPLAIGAVYRIDITRLRQSQLV